MDPNDTLRILLELARENEDGEMEANFLYLHEWFMQGGFLPQMWSDKIRNRPLLIESDDPWINPQTVGEPPF